MSDETTPTCPHRTLRPELDALPARIATLPIDDRGYPVPWFVAWVNGTPEFRAADRDKWVLAINKKLCWVCGAQLGANMAFVAGPMCGLNRTSAEPPCHLECAEWSARNCPFLARPHMVRREDGTLNTEILKEQSAGNAIPRNPGVALVWVTRSYSLFNDGNGGYLIRMGPAERMIWYAEGQPATRTQVAASVDSGLPALLERAELQDSQEPNAGAVRMLMKMKTDYEATYPPEAKP